MRVAVFGAGAVGGFLGARLSSRAEVLLIGRPPFVRAVRRRGLRVRGLAGRPFRLEATSDAQGARDADLIVLTTKAYDTPRAALQLSRAGVRSPVLSLQNGLTNTATLKRTLKDNPLLGGSIVVGVIREAPGTVRYTGGGRAVVGPVRGGAGPAREAASLFTRAGIPTRTTGDVQRVLWQKAIVNAAVNPLTAILRCPNGDLLTRADARLVSVLAAREATAAARAHGVKADADPWPEVERVLRDTPTNRSSMLQDIEAGRPTEMDAITGEIVRVANRHRVAVPVNKALLDLVLSL